MDNPTPQNVALNQKYHAACLYLIQKSVISSTKAMQNLANHARRPGRSRSKLVIETAKPPGSETGGFALVPKPPPYASDDSGVVSNRQARMNLRNRRDAAPTWEA
jgi:hypothetical protein